MLTDDNAVEWIGKFAEVNDHIDLEYDKNKIIAVLEGAGYTADAEVGNKDVEAVPSIFAKWLVKQ